MDRTVDYVVVGAGSAGCVLARRLADSGASVALIEAGGPDTTRLVRKPGMIAVFHNIPQLKKRLAWEHYTVPQAHANNRKIPQTHGRVRGGSGSINGMVFVRGNRKNFDDWAAEGNTGWSYADVLPYYRRFESWEDGANDFRGGDGPIRVTRQKDLTTAGQAFIEALAETAGVKRNDDYNGEDQEGSSIFQMNVAGGLRYSSSIGYLEDHTAANLQVVLGTLVTRVVIENGRAVGVEIITKSGLQTIRANREVVVSAGAFGTPQVLMLSGIGPADHLRSHGIDVVADLPVGDNLHDHMFVPLTYLTKESRHRGTTPYFAAGVMKEALRGDSWLARSVFEAVGFVRSPQAKEIPDIQLHALPWSYPFPNQDAPIRHKVDKRSAITIMATLIYPRSRGTVRLASTDPAAAPLIDPNYLGDNADRELLLDAMELVREVMANPVIARGITGELSPGPNYSSRAELSAEVPNRATTVYHPVGTARMGVDERAVVDPTLKVRGVDGLRVADASIMPSITGGNTNAPSMMIGEHAAALIL